ncbi:MAG: S-layer homology domain-containing protein [Ruminiclostridium sp.]|nr:S-layer homology domain-containing protein [Ruminiclostridium sp.]
MNIRPKRILSSMIILALLLSLCPLVPASASSAGRAILEQDGKVPSGYVADQNPYGFPVGQPFNLNPSHELLFFGGADGGKHAGLEDTNGGGLQDFVENPRDSTGSRDFNLPDGTWSFVQATAFSPDANGRDNYAAFVGVNGKHAKVWVSSLEDSKPVSEVYDLGEITWMNDDYNQFQSTSLFDIVAGDFDCDGKDTLVVYVPNSGDDYMLTELSYDSGKKTLTQKAESKGLLMSAYFSSSIDRSDRNSANKLAVSMTVSDLNGDRIDDLAVLSYCHRVGASDVSLDCYKPSLKVVYGTKSGTSKAAVSQTGTNVGNIWYKDTNNNSIHTFPAAASLVSGDFNGDSVADLFVVGARATAGVKDGSKVDGKITVYDKYWYMQGIFTSVDGKGNVKLVPASPYYVDTNGWWVGGFYSSDDSCWGEVMAEAVAFGGMGTRELLFVSGRIYDVGGSSPKTPVHSVSYFNYNDDGAKHAVISNTHVQSVAAGNFDGNENGQEQVVFTIGLKQKGQDDYYFMCVYIAGKYNDRNELIGYENIDVQDDSEYIYENKGDDQDEGLNCLVLAVDNDKDGDVVKYLGSDYLYADPEVKAVIQAAPYFGELTDYSYNSTSYRLETSYGDADGSVKSEHYGAGFAGNATAYVLSVSASLTYDHNITTTTQAASTTTHANTYTALSQDVVVVQRVPFTVHNFHEQNEDGTWPAASAEANRTCLIPMEPFSTSLTVDEYNDFVDEYNGKIEKAVADKKVTGNWMPLVKLDPEENYLAGNEGNPYAYNIAGVAAVPAQGATGYSANAEVLSKELHSMDYSGGSKTVTWSESNTTTESKETTNGVSFAATITGGKYWGGATAGVGVALNATGAWGDLYSTTEGTLVDTSCTVKDVDKKALVAGGQRGEIIDQYGFQWGMLGWERHLSGNNDPKADLDSDGEADGVCMTPVIGYYLTDVKSPALSVKDLKASVEESTVTLAWSQPQQHEGWPAVRGYKVYEVTDAGYILCSSAVIDGTTATISGCAPDSKHTYVVTTCDEDGQESVWSNQAEVTVPGKYYTLTFTADPEDAATVTAYEYSKTDEIYASGASIPGGTTVTVKAAPHSGYAISGFEVLRGGEPAPGVEAGDTTGARYCSFPMAADTTVKVKTTTCLSDLTPTFTDVNPNQWYFEGVDYALANGFMKGIAANRFAPEGAVNRAMMVTILHRVEGEPVAEASSFADVADDTWYTDAVDWAAENGIVTGYHADAFGPMDPITREQIAAILYRYAEYRGCDLQAAGEGNLVGFGDAASISPYAVTAMDWAVGERLITGVKQDILFPDGTATRAQVATVLMRICEELLA